jgi:hypothetical protein
MGASPFALILMFLKMTRRSGLLCLVPWAPPFLRSKGSQIVDQAQGGVPHHAALHERKSHAGLETYR